jgi:hypothetical protein
VIPLNQLIPECLLALGGAFLLGNLAAYIRLRPAWREAKQGRGGQGAKGHSGAGGGGQGAKGHTGAGGGGRRAKGDARINSGTTTEASPPGRVGTTAGRSVAGNQRRGQSRPGGANAAAGADHGRTGSGKGAPERPRSGGAKAAARTRAGSSGRVNARVREPTAPGSKLPPRARVLANVLIGLVITVAALATLIRG